MFTYELDTLALVRLRLAQRAELRSDLAYELLVDALQRYDRVALFLRNGRSGHFGRKHQVCIVRIAEAHFQDIALDFSLEADADELLLDFITFRNADHHIIDQGAVQTVQRTVTGLVGRTRHQHGRNLFLRMNVGVRTHLYFNV